MGDFFYDKSSKSIFDSRNFFYAHDLKPHDMAGFPGASGRCQESVHDFPNGQTQFLMIRPVKRVAMRLTAASDRKSPLAGHKNGTRRL